MTSSDMATGGPGPAGPRPTPSRRRGGGRGLVVLALVLGLVATGAYGVRAVIAGPDCAVSFGDGSERTLSRSAAMRATTVVATALRRGDSTEQVASALRAEQLGTRGDTRALATALLSGRPALDCSGDPASVRAQREGGSGLTPRAAGVLRELESAFGDQHVGGFAPGGISTGHSEGSAHYDGRAVDVFFRPPSPANRQRGWAMAQWMVAHSEQLRIATVIYDRKIWSSRWSLDHWRDYELSGEAASNPVLLHLDHVHVDVLD